MERRQRKPILPEAQCVTLEAIWEAVVEEMRVGGTSYDKLSDKVQIGKAELSLFLRAIRKIKRHEVVVIAQALGVSEIRLYRYVGLDEMRALPTKLGFDKFVAEIDQRLAAGDDDEKHLLTELAARRGSTPELIEKLRKPRERRRGSGLALARADRLPDQDVKLELSHGRAAELVSMAVDVIQHALKKSIAAGRRLHIDVDDGEIKLSFPN